MLTAELITTTTDALLENKYEWPEPPAQPMPSYDGPRERVNILVYQLIGELHTDNPDIPDSARLALEGRVMSAFRSHTEGNGWHLGQWYASGAVLNPAPVDGHHYRVIGEAGQLVKYIAPDGEHNNSGWNVVLDRSGAPWLYGTNDYLTSNPGVYIEVEYSAEPGPSTLADAFADGSLDDLLNTEEQTPGHPVVSTYPSIRFEDKAVTNQSGLVEQVTEFVDGTLYVGADPHDNDRLFFGLKQAGEDEPLSWGVWTRAWGGSFGAPSLTERRPNNLIWAKALVTTPQPVSAEEEATQLNLLRTLIEERRAGFEAFNDALNEMADKKDWCEEYERAVGRIGMRGRREKEPVRIRIEVRVDLTMEMDHPRDYVTDRLESDTGVDSITNLRFDAQTLVWIDVTMEHNTDYDEGFDADDLGEYVELSSVQDELEAQLSGSASWSVEDWNVTGEWERQED